MLWCLGYKVWNWYGSCCQSVTDQCFYYFSPEVRSFLSLDNPRNASEPVDTDTFEDSEAMVNINISCKLMP